MDRQFGPRHPPTAYMDLQARACHTSVKRVRIEAGMECVPKCDFTCLKKEDKYFTSEYITLNVFIVKAKYIAKPTCFANQTCAFNFGRRF